ncbi:hypothetical protein ABH920_009204 [Catenulispora sp. EB89]
MALVIALTPNVFCTRRSGFFSLGTRVHTIADALAMSIAATRATCSTACSRPCLKSEV